MILQNLRVKVTQVTDDGITVETEQEETIVIPRHLVPEAKEGMGLFLAIDQKPLISSEKQAKDILNEIIRE